jgi:hypothetical protein
MCGRERGHFGLAVTEHILMAGLFTTAMNDLAPRAYRRRERPREAGALSQGSAEFDGFRLDLALIGQ